MYMKKLVLLCNVLLLLVGSINAQTGFVYNDANEIRNAITAKDSALIRKIVSYYFQNSDGQFDTKDFNKSNSRHMFLLRYITAGTGSSVLASPQGGLSSPSPAMAIDAIGTFIANRFKQEINIAFLTKFKNDLNNIPLLGCLLPQSKMVLQQSDPYNYTNFMEALREAFENDLKQLPSGISTAVKKGELKFNDSNEKFLFLVLLNYSQNVLANPGSPLSSFGAMANDVYLDSISDKNTRQTVEGIIYTVNALRVNDSRGAFIGSSDLNKLRKDTLLQQAYLALLEQQNKNLSISVNIDEVINKLFIASNMVTSINAQIAPIVNASNMGQLKTEQVVKYYQTSVNILTQLLNFGRNELNISYSAKVDSVWSDLQQISNISSNMLNKQYSLAAINSIALLENNVAPATLQPIRTYLVFATNMLKAESSDDMVQALENAALPVGSYRVKRNSTFNVSVNAFGGTFYGHNFNTDTSLFGFSAPVGIYAGWGNIVCKATNQYKGRGKSIGLFFPLIDVGAVTSFRLAGGTAELADVSWANVFAPGAYLSLGLGRCPVSINIGGQMGPELSSVSATGAPVFYNKDWFWRAGVLIDIPVFDFYTQQYRHKTPCKKPNK